MRKLHFLIALMIVSFYVNGQIPKKTLLIGGRAVYGSNDNESSRTFNRKTNDFNISISIGKAIKENKVVGILAGYSNTKMTDEINTSNTYNSNYYDLGFYYRQYKTLGKGFYLFGQSDLTGTIGKRKQTISAGKETEANYYGGTIAFSPGVSYQICPKLQIELSLVDLFSISYNEMKTTDDTPIEDHYYNKNFSVNTNLKDLGSLGNLAIGLQFTF